MIGSGTAGMMQMLARPRFATSFTRNTIGAAVPLALLGWLVAATGAHAAPPTKVDFARDIRPILSHHCIACHGFDEKARKAKLRLDLRASALARKAIVPGDAKASALVERIESADASEQMPPSAHKRPLTAKQKRLLRTWVAQGAPYTQHWAFTPPHRHALPSLKDGWVRNPIDAFVLQRIRRERLQPSPEADRPTLLRRVTLDLTGLPPSLPELNAFLADRSAGAYGKAVDRLLASPRYAERMALGWLDAARYADTNGFNNDEDRTQWPWRDWVIDAFAGNMPFDRFVLEQIAGDMLPGATVGQKVATAFHRNQVHNTEGGIIPEEYRVEYVADRVHTTATVFLGLSMQCARCHDHKFDPITQREYYQFFGFFNSVSDKPASYVNFVAAEPFLRLPTEKQQKHLAGLDRRIADLERRLAARKAGDPEHARLTKELAAARAEKAAYEKAIPAVMVMLELPRPRETFLLKRGEYDQRGEKVSPGVPAVLPPLPAGVAANRLGLARWLVDPANPLTARVAVNRWWQMIFGTGLVKTVEDFGVTGDLPSHPELLDFLAAELIDSGWDVKAMLRLIVTSTTYRQSSRISKELAHRDPENRLLARGSRFRLSAEGVRDNALAVSGLLAERRGGPSVKPYQPAGLWEDVTVERRGHYVSEKGENLYRRSMYTFWKRTCPPPALMSFDAPNREVCVARRATTNTPLQALVLLNDPTYVEAARKLAERMMHAGGRQPEACATFGFRRATARVPTAAELGILLKIHDEARARFRADRDAARKLLGVGESPRNPALDEIELAAWTTVASTILNLDETISRR